MSSLMSERLASDPRVQRARALLAEAVAEHRATLTQVRSPDPARLAGYGQLLEQFGKLRGGSLYYPYLGSGGGRGALVELGDGSVKYDLISGIGVHHLGHGHAAMLEASIDAALADTLMQGNLQQTKASVSLSAKLVEWARAGGAAMAHCFLTTSGAMANENALKLALQKRHPASRILAFAGGFAGRTLALSQITDKPAFRGGLPTVLAVDYVPFFDPDRSRQSTDAAVRVLGAHLSRYPGQHAAMCLELVQGEGGYHVGERAFFVALCDMLKEAGVAVFFDEVQTFGRTTRPYAFQHFGLDAYADIVTIGKMTQVCATLFSDAWVPRPGLISQTFTGATAAILAAERLLETLDEAGCFGQSGRNAAVHDRFVEHFEAIAARHPGVLHGPFGMGGMIACTPLNGSEAKVKRFAHALFDAGVIGFVAGTSPVRMRFLPPVPVIRDEDIDAACGIIEATLVQVASETI